MIWELLMEQLDGDRCRYTNTVTSHPTEDFLQFIANNGQTFPEAAEARQEASGRHCRLETPLYAQSIARWAAAHAAATARQTAADPGHRPRSTLSPYGLGLST